MADFNRNLLEWFQNKGKVLVFRLIVAGGAIILGLSVFGIFEIPINVSLFFLLSVIFLFAEIFLTEIGHVKKLKNEGLILNWNEASSLLRTEIIHAKQITIIARTGETFYYAIRDILLNKGKFKLILILTQVLNEEEDFLDYQQGWIKRWQTMFNEITGEIEIYTTTASEEIQGVILDDRYTYFGFREKPAGTDATLLSHLRTSTFSTQGRFIMRYILNWIKNHKLNHVKNN
jgi:hypothetical protein